MQLIAFDVKSGTFLLSTPHTSYALRMVDEGVRHVHWGARLTLEQAASIPLRDPARDGELFDEELTVEGGIRFGPAGLAVEFADGVRAVELIPADHEISEHGDKSTLRIGLVDRFFPLRVDLHYRVYRDSDVIERWTTLTHTDTQGEPIAVTQLDSAGWTMPMRDDYRLSHTSGDWSAEFALERIRLPYGETVTSSPRGSTRHQVNPWMAIDSGDASEDHGEVWTMALAWSGSFRMIARRTLGGHVTITGGAVSGGATAQRRQLGAGESWEAPVAAGAYSANGFGGASRAFHRYTLEHVLPHPDELPPVLYNSWEGASFDVTSANQIDTARRAAALGVELYVMDDGWFGARNDDRAGLGDWWPSRTKFPDGLSPLAEEVRRLGMRFGIWVEPEMVNPDSDLYRLHPDWALHMPHRQRTEMRNQLVLNFGRDDVRDWAYAWLTELVSSAGVEFFKWDMNRPFTEAGWPGATDPARLWIEHTEGVYRVIDRLRETHPDLRIETCASGGGRADFGILTRTDQVWTSDNTDPVDRLAIQHGFTQLYPPIVMGAWATACPNPITGRVTSLEFRLHSAMAGALGLSGHLDTWTDAERAEASDLIATYKRIRPLVAHGDLHRLAYGSLIAVEYVARDASEAVVLGFRPAPRHGEPAVPVRMRGLDPDALYIDEDGPRVSGAVLMTHGLDLRSRLPAGDHQSVLVHMKRE